MQKDPALPDARPKAQVCQHLLAAAALGGSVARNAGSTISTTSTTTTATSSRGSSCRAVPAVPAVVEALPDLHLRIVVGSRNDEEAPVVFVLVC